MKNGSDEVDYEVIVYCEAWVLNQVDNVLDWSITCLAYVECQAVLAIVNQLMLQIISDYATNMTQFSEFLVEKSPKIL